MHQAAINFELMPTGDGQGGVKIEMKHKIISVLTVLGLGFLLWFFRPISYQGTAVVCNVEGKTVEVVYNVVWHRHCLGNDGTGKLGFYDKICGRLMIEGVEYISAWDFYSNYRGIAGYFICPDSIPTVPSGQAANVRKFAILDLKKGFDSFSILVMEPEGGNYYYGPEVS